MTPRTTDSYQIYTLALAGDTIAFGARQGSMSQMWQLWWGVLQPAPEFTVLEQRTGLAGCWDGGGGLGSAVGAAGLLFFATWADHVAPAACSSVTEHEEIHLIESGACPCPVIASSAGPLAPFDVDAGRLVVGGELATLVLDPTGNQLRSIPVSPLAAQLDESDLVILRQGALLHYDVRNVTLLRSFSLPSVPSGGDCGRPHGVGWECRGARLRLQDLAHGFAAYVFDGQVHVLRVADGVDKTIGTGTMARFLDEGLAYADGARIRFLPWSQLG
jgi:hypothetical protein